MCSPVRGSSDKVHNIKVMVSEPYVAIATLDSQLSEGRNHLSYL